MVTTAAVASAMVTQLNRVSGRDNPRVLELEALLAAQDAEIARLRTLLRQVQQPGKGISVNGRPTYTVEQVRQQWNYRAASSVIRHLNKLEHVTLPDGTHRIYADTCPLNRPPRKPRSANKSKTR